MKKSNADDLRGVARLIVHAAGRVTLVVEAMHRTIAAGPNILGRPFEFPAQVITGGMYGAIVHVMQLIGSGIDVTLSQIAPLLGESAPGADRIAMLAALNGVVGDYLNETRNPLAIEMCICHAGQPLALDSQSVRDAIPHANGKLLVMVHGSSMSDLQWNRAGHDHGATLAGDYTTIYLRYNSGLHISTNGRTFADLLERLLAAWPVAVNEIAIIGHSMGGLVARSACHVAEQDGHHWRQMLRKLICIGTPNHGAPLERGGNWIDTLLGVSRYSAPIGRLARLRSAGVTDLRFGNVLDEHWSGRDRFAHGSDTRHPLPLPEGVQCYAIAGTKSTALGRRLRSDGLVPVDSALGRHRLPRSTLAFPDAHQWIALGTSHVGLLGSAAVSEKLREWLK